MTNADRIRKMTDEELVSILVWRNMPNFVFVPGCDEGCDDECSGCALSCHHEKQERAVRKWLQEEY